MKHILLLFILLFSSSEALAFEFKSLFKEGSKLSEFFNNFGDKGDKTVNFTPHVKSLVNKINTENAKNNSGSMTPKIDLVDYAKFEITECKDCPEYIELSDDVSTILSKMESFNEETKQFVNYQANSIKFLSYQIRHEDIDNKITCSKSFGIQDTDLHQYVNDIKFAHSEVVTLPNFSSLQYVDTTNQEVRYLYKINTHGKDQLVEMFIKNGQARIFYFDYTASPYEFQFKIGEEKYSLPEFWSERTKTENEFDLDIEKEKTIQAQNFNAKIKFDPDFILNENKIPTNLSIATIETETKITDSSSLNTTSEINLTTQSLEAVFKKNDQHFLKVNATNDDETGQKLIAVVPLKVTINEDTGLSLDASFRQQDQFLKDKINNNDHISDNTVTLAIKDKNNQYINVVLYNNNDANYQSIMASNTTKINDRNSVSANFQTDSNGSRNYSVSHSIAFHKYGELTTTFGVEKLDENAKDIEYFKVDHSMQIGKRSTMAIEATTQDGEMATVMFRLQTRNK